MSKILVWDIDGTIADSTWRLPLIKNKPKNWKKFMSDSVNDKPIEQTKFIFHSVMDHPDVVTIMMTARDEEQREITETWLAKNGFKYHEMFMRKNKDNRPDYEVKCELIAQIKEKYGEIFAAFEDRPNVVTNCYHKLGVYVFDVGNGAE